MGDEPRGLTVPESTARPAGGGRTPRATSAGPDLTFAVRQLRRHPAFTAIAVLTLALGIGVTTAMFSVVHQLLLDPIPFRDGDRMVRLYQGMRALLSNGDDHMVLARPSVVVARAWRDRSRTLEQVVWRGQGGSVLVGDDSASTLVQADAISSDVPSFLGIRPVLGRSFAADETRPGAEPTVVLGNGLWRSRFGGARDVIGRTLRVDDTLRTIIGVMPPGISLPGELPVGVWLPLVIRSDSDAVIPWARLRPGVSVQAAERELAGIFSEVARPSERFKLSAQVVPLRDYLGTHVQRAIGLIAAAVGLVLLIACGNVANLLLARAAGRQRELSMRTALGASRWRLVRQFAAESLCITLLAGSFGVLLAWRVIAVVDATRPSNLATLDAARLDLTAVLWTVGVSVATGLLFGTVPLLVGAGRNPADVLKSASRTASGSREGVRLRAALIVGEIALSVALLVGAGLLIRSVRALQTEDVGFDPHGLTSMYVWFPGPRFARPEAAKAALDQLVREVRLLPGVSAVTLAAGAPPTSGIMFGGLEVADQPAGVVDSTKFLGFNEVQPDFFKVLHLPIVAGRVLDSDTAAHTVMVSTAMAQHYWPGVSALGKRVRFGPGQPWQVVAGVVAETRAPGESMALPYQLYTPLTLRSGGMLIVRASRPSPHLQSSMTRLASAIDPRTRVDARSMDAEFAALFAGRRFTMMLLSVFAAFAFVLSTVGLYGVMAYAVVQRTREMGVRLAVGATPRAITQLVVRDGARLAAAGLVAGALFTFGLTRVARSVLAGVGSLDPAIFVAVAALMAVAAVLASYIPARRAARVDPAIALRAE
ncbi:MAG TPA: ABC transporter permease [Gemmatimonadaceae bacterium]